jgi:hypothetical protein
MREVTASIIAASVVVASVTSSSRASRPASRVFTAINSPNAHSVRSHHSERRAPLLAIPAAIAAPVNAINAPTTAKRPAIGGPEKKSRQNASSKTNGGKRLRHPNPMPSPNSSAAAAQSRWVDRRRNQRPKPLNHVIAQCPCDGLYMGRCAGCRCRTKRAQS